MATTLTHRGPDDAGMWTSPGCRVTLAHRRLSIVDLSPLGRNPMQWESGRFWITFNGEIYNYRELRDELEAAGARFRSRTDTEVILAAYDRWGTECVQRFAGMFAFALWDDSRERLWLVRDRLGKKPLYYCCGDGRLTFASELKALVSDPSFDRELDPNAVDLYLQYGYVPAPLTIFRAARKLPPAHEALFERGALTIRRYWDPLSFVNQHRDISESDAEEELERLLATSVSQRQIADVPLGAFLSGGIDSSLVVALMREHSAARVRTFTIRFEDPRFNEADHAAAVARHLETEHYEETCTLNDALEIAPRVPAMYDEPFADSSAIPTFLVSRAARRHVTVALSGDGGDELFVGYPRYQYLADRGWALSLPRPVRWLAALTAGQLPNRRIRRVADVLRDDGSDVYGRFIHWFSEAQVATMTARPPAAAPAYAEAKGRLSAMSAAAQAPLLDLVSYLPDDILTKVDRASMAVSLEVRSPLLDHRIAEFALGLPMNLKRRNGTSKWLLRQLLYKRVPKSLIDRPKMGFGVPLADWFRAPLRKQMADYCGGDELRTLGLDPAPARRLWSDFLAGRGVRADLLWQIFVLVSWAREHRPVVSETRAAR